MWTFHFQNRGLCSDWRQQVRTEHRSFTTVLISTVISVYSWKKSLQASWHSRMKYDLQLAHSGAHLPVMANKLPGFTVGVAQIHSTHNTWSVEMGQVSDVCSVFRDFLQENRCRWIVTFICICTHLIFKDSYPTHYLFFLYLSYFCPLRTSV